MSVPDPANTAAPSSSAAGRRRPSIRRGIRNAVPVAAGALAMVAVLAVSSMVGPRPLTRADVDTAIASALADVTPQPPWSELVYQAIAPSFVIIEADGGAGAPASSPAAAPPGASQGPTHSLGSGVVVSANGDILTALHVVDGASSIRLVFADGSASSAFVVASRPDRDVAVLRASEPPATIVPATLGNPRADAVGDDAFVVGNPFGLTQSVSTGVVSGLNRSFQDPASGRTFTGLIQFDAAANPGNSGGPLLNRAGQVVGIVTSIINPTGQDVFIGIGLAVPIDVAGGAAGLPPD